MLPDFIPPMLAKIGEPFSSDDYSFEIKWDGTRALALIDDGDYQLLNRKRNPSKERYPELRYLSDLPSGCALDGEIVTMVDSKPSFHGMLRREQARGEPRVRALMREMPAIYMVFDLLYVDGVSIMDQPLAERRARLVELLEPTPATFSDGVVGEGEAYFQKAREEGLEGIVAKRLNSVYRPGKRTGAWVKIKYRPELLCVIMGYLAEGDDLRSLVVATSIEGETELRCVGRVGSGLTDPQRRQLFEDFRPLRRSAPIVPASVPDAVRVQWVEPEIFCRVSFLEWNPDGGLRAPVFEGIVDPD